MTEQRKMPTVLYRARISFVTADPKLKKALMVLTERTKYEPRLINTFVQRALEKFLETKAGRDLLIQYELADEIGLLLEGEKAKVVPEGQILDVAADSLRQDASRGEAPAAEPAEQENQVGIVLNVGNILGIEL